MRLASWVCRRGTAAVEFALIAPFLLLLLGGIIELGRAVYDNAALAGAARAGAQYAWLEPNDNAGIVAAASAASGLPAGSIRVSAPVRFCECPNGAASSCDTGCASGALRRFVQVDVQRDFGRISNLLTVVVPSVLTARAVVRTQ
ncbi:TadE/TadG family type IV pilus assembly protein [Azospirillum sp.]|uniref:TadE/TadG family type IV pilus assembly protein n=1 Tax=Azospirillum sp. TaxID=34012 RepID=UPI003D74BF1A